MKASGSGPKAAMEGDIGGRRATLDDSEKTLSSTISPVSASRTRSDSTNGSFMSSQSGYHTTEDDNDDQVKSPPRSYRATPATEQVDDVSALRTQLQDLTVSTQGEIAYWKTQVDQSKQDMVEILGHAEDLSQACEELEDEVAGLKAENARLKSLVESSDASPSTEGNSDHQRDMRSRLAVALDGEGGDDPSLLELLAKSGVAQQLSAVAHRLRGEQRRTEAGTTNDDVNRFVAEQLGLLGTLLEGAAREMLHQATELATEKEAHDVTASRLALLQKKYAVEEMKNSVRGAAGRTGTGSPIKGASPGTPRSASHPSRRPRSAKRPVPLSPNGSNWDETLRESIPVDTDIPTVTIDHSRRNSILGSRRASLSTSNGRRRPTEYPSAAPSPVRRRERTDQRSTSRPRAGSPPPQYSKIDAAGSGSRSSTSASVPRKRNGGRGGSSKGRGAPNASLGYRRTTAASLSHEPASVLKGRKSAEVDKLTADLKARFAENGCPLPFVKKADFVYQLGNRKVNLNAVSSKLVVRMGGGYTDFLEFLETARF